MDRHISSIPRTVAGASEPIMLNIKFDLLLLRGLVACALLIGLLTGCGSRKVDEETASLYLSNASYDDLVSVLQDYSSKNNYEMVTQTLPGARPETTAQQIMLNGNGIRVLLQSALADQCEEREGRRDVEYSSRVFDVDAFVTSYFESASDLSEQVDRLEDELTGQGFRIVSKYESCVLH